jgi:endonuclease YncB( thermonuclease family)
MKYLSICLLLLTILILPVQAAAKGPNRTIEGVVTNVLDGNTIQVKDSAGIPLMIRLYGIYAPEVGKGNLRTGRISRPGQPYGEESAKALAGKVASQKVRIEIIGSNLKSRSSGIVSLNGRDINKEMLSEGHAWAYRQFLIGEYATEYIKLEEQARSKKAGLWKQSNPQPPWDYRRSARMVKRGRMF